MSLPQLWWQFIKIGVAAFGGLGVTLSLIERYLVKDRRVLIAEDVTESLTYTKLLPGSTGGAGRRLPGIPSRRLAWRHNSHECISSPSISPDARVIGTL
jgi:Chromate transporter